MSAKHRILNTKNILHKSSRSQGACFVWHIASQNLHRIKSAFLRSHNTQVFCCEDSGEDELPQILPPRCCTSLSERWIRASIDPDQFISWGTMPLDNFCGNPLIAEDRCYLVNVLLEEICPFNGIFCVRLTGAVGTLEWGDAVGQLHCAFRFSHTGKTDRFAWSSAHRPSLSNRISEQGSWGSWATY